MSKNAKLEAKISKGKLIIEIGIDTLAFATKFKPDNYNYNKNNYPLKIINPPIFAHDVLSEMENEDEQGYSPLTNFLDEMCEKAINNGSIAVKISNQKESERDEKEIKKRKVCLAFRKRKKNKGSA